MSENELTLREREYLECDVPMVSTGSAVGRVSMGIFASLFQAAFMPGVDKADRSLMKTIREIRYTKYKKAVLRKQSGTAEKKDIKTLEKLNKKSFVLEVDTYDADKFTAKVYEEYMKKNEERRTKK